MNWKKVWKVTKVVVGIGSAVLFVIAILGGSAGSGGCGSSMGSGGGSIWTVGSGQTKKFGSWSSMRHK